MHLFGRSLIVKLFSKQRLKTTLYLSLSVISKSQNQIMSKSGSDAIRRIDDIIKSAEDKRTYRGLELSNRLKVLLISDPQTDKSAAALDVNVGYLSDPDEIPGLAHFLEHMLFLGTEKYPSENEYSKFLSENGGSSNAATYSDHTNFYFDVVPEQLPGALDRFAQFFLCPLFTESATDRELLAVNSEHDKNVKSDGWRMEQLDRHTADPSHPYHKFGTGNKETLDELPKKNGVKIRDEVMKFHGKWYSANIMSLAILGRESLDELEELVVALFANVEDKNIEQPVWREHPFKEKQLCTSTHMVPIKDIRNLNILFPCKDLHDNYKSSPGGYISNLIGHEGPGSLLSALKARGWSNNLIAGHKAPNRGTAFFGVSVDLTEEGLLHTNDIITMVFQYINMLKNQGPLEWLQNEQKRLMAMTFRFKDKESPRSYTSSIVHNLHEYPMEHVLCNYFLLSEWEPEVITEVLDSFAPEKIRVGIIARKYEGEVDMKEPWYGTEYKTEKIAQDVLDMWNGAGTIEELKFPEKNDFIPENFELYPLEADKTEHPAIIKDTAITRLWYKQDDQFLLPKANLMFDFVCPLAYLDPLNCNLTRMFTQLFRDSLNQYAYSAELAGLKWDLANTKYGLVLSIGGFSDKQHIFLDKVMEKLTNFKVDPQRFEIFKENYIRTLNNFAAEQPYQHAVYYLALLIVENAWSKQELLAAMELLTIDKLEAFIPQILSKLHIECFIHGNINKQKALDLVEIVEKHLKSSFNMAPLLPRELLLNREISLANGCNYIYEAEHTVHTPSCIEVYYQCGLQETKPNVLLELLAQIIQEPCFNILRTKEQLGYIVYSGLRRSSGVQGIRFIIQSDKHPEFLDERIEEFLRYMHTYITDMSEEDFQKHKESLAAKRLEKPKQLSIQSYLFWSEITGQQYNFDRANVEVAQLRTLTKTDVLEYYNRLIDENAKMRHKLAVHVISTAEGGAGAPSSPVVKPDSPGKKISESKEIVQVATRIHDITEFKSAQGMYQLVEPYIDIVRKGNRSKL